MMDLLFNIVIGGLVAGLAFEAGCRLYAAIHWHFFVDKDLKEKADAFCKEWLESKEKAKVG